MSSTPIKADELTAAWARAIWKPVYLFAGEEDFLIEEAVRKIRAHRLTGDNAELNHDRFDGEKVSAGEILQACQTVPFLGEGRVVEVRNTGRLSAEAQKELAAHVTRLPPSTAVIFLWGKEWRRDDAERPLPEAVLSVGDIVIFWPLYPNVAQRWVTQRSRQYQKSIDADAAAWLVDINENSLRRLDNELAKVAAYVGGRPAITLDDVQACLGYERLSSPFEWLHAIRQKDRRKTLQTFQRLLEDGEEPLYLLALLSGSLRDWLSAKSGQENLATLARRFRLRRGEESSFLQELENHSEEDLVEGIAGCLEGDQLIKTGKETPEMALTLLMLRLCGLQVLNAGG